MNYKSVSMFDLNPMDLTNVVHPMYQNLYLRRLKRIKYLEVHHVLVIEQLSKNDGLFDDFGEVRKDVPFSLRCHINNTLKRGDFHRGKLPTMGGGRTRSVEMEPPRKELSEYEQIPPLSASVVEYEKKHGVTKKTINITSPTIEEMLANPELDSLSTVNIDPASMLVDDIEALVKEGKEFIKNPTLVGVASMAIIAIPGKVAEFGSSVTKDYKKTFFNEYPDLEGKVIVHHAVEQQVQRRYPGLVSNSEVHSLENLRGIPKEKNNELHLSKIRKEWNRFYKTNPNPSKEDLLKKATEIDLKLGGEFKPPVGD